MSRTTPARRAVAEIRWENDRSGVACVANRPIYQYWAMLSSYFREVLLPPQRRAEDNGVSWTWREPADPQPVTAAELRALRKRLVDERQLFIENLAREGGGARGEAGEGRGQVDREQLGAVVADVVARLVARSDVELSAFVCRTEAGPRVHSWGAASAARPVYPDTDGIEIAGRVLVGGKPARHDVVLESGDGETLAETPSDAAGEFRFPKLSPGDYRLRVRTLRRTFPSHGHPVVLKRESVTDVVLSDAGEPAPGGRSARRGLRRGSRRNALVLAIAAVVVAGGAWSWTEWQVRPEPSAVTARLDASELPTGREVARVAGETAKIPTRESVPVRAELRSDLAEKPVEKNPVRKGVAWTPPTTAASAESPDRVSRDELRLPVETGVVRRDGLPLSESGLPWQLSGQPMAGGGMPGVAGGVGGAAPGSGSPASAQAGATASSTSGATSAAAPVSPSARSASDAQGALGSATTLSPSAALRASPALSAVAPVAPTDVSTPAETAKSSNALSGTEKEVPATPALLAAIPPDPSKAAATKTTGETPSSVPAVAADPVVAADATRSREDVASAIAAVTPRPESDSRAGSAAPIEAANSDEGSSAPREPRHRVIITRGEVRSGPPPLSRTVRVRVSPWRTRVLGDTILPTQPVRASEAERLAAVRARIQDEQNARLPLTFRAPDTRTGLVLELPAAEPAGNLSWVDHNGVALADATLDQGWAKIFWMTTNAPAERVFRLLRRDLTVVAEVRVEPRSHDFTVRTTEGIQTRLRLAVQIAPTDVARESNPDDPAPRYGWRAASGAPRPPTWREATLGTDRVMHEVSVALGSTAGAVSIQGCALLDHDTGWAIVTDVRQAADRPLGE